MHQIPPPPPVPTQLHRPNKLDIGDAIDFGFQRLAQRWVGFIGLAAAVIAAVLLIAVAGVAVLEDDTPMGVMLFIIAFAVGFAGQVVTLGVYVLAAMEPKDGPHADFPDLLRDAVARAVPLALTLLLQAIGVMGVAVVTFFLLGLPAVMLGVWWSLAVIVVMVEHKSGPDALVRSQRLTKGNFWPLLGLILVTWVITAVLAGVMGVVLGMILPEVEAAMLIGQVIPSAVTAPILSLVLVGAYLQLIEARPATSSTPPAAPSPYVHY